MSTFLQGLTGSCHGMSCPNIDNDNSSDRSSLYNFDFSAFLFCISTLLPIKPSSRPFVNLHFNALYCTTLLAMHYIGCSRVKLPTMNITESHIFLLLYCVINSAVMVVLVVVANIFLLLILLLIVINSGGVGGGVG